MADNFLLEGDHRAAASYYNIGLQHLHRLGRTMGPQAEHVSSTIGWLDQRFAEYLDRGLAERGFPRKDWHPRFASSIAIMQGKASRAPVPVRYPQNPQTFFYDGLPLKHFAERETFAWTEAVEAQADEIRREGESLLMGAGGFDPKVETNADHAEGDVRATRANGDWTNFELTSNGTFVDERAALCPVTTASLTDNAPLCRIVSRAPTLTFSLLAAGQRTPPKHGMMNIRFTCHLPLVVPGESALRVGPLQKSWEVGKLIMFDDTVEHQAWNNATKDGLALVFDVWRPELEEVEREQIQALFATVDAY
ncbi:aspartyl/asparaginyl beta-hydroxylase domain-containing protein [Alteriqipengyuania sp. NZ-12B]|uniref:Aspartyl/asparaginyl beta-hydroxylase domain-containing protein n=1 Tax=Alteriqipengyuania abyssalis TaxID=2860200 RepID=A0ABS7PAP1_9SPHN|nr:aspartyl/asparaginyl beta-hydroxylase domain-containing protein [Alteriqipengyuania abyssalis]MBY8336066.1 aspartyl/asparaginyl beta-hydroxylase domain-containing protein [Alteriqipengyuania abyssalis]